MNATLKTALLLLAALLAWVSWVFATRPDLDKLEEQIKRNDSNSETAYRENYNHLVESNLRTNKTFLLNEAVSATICNNYFPYSATQLDANSTRGILNILNDTASYKWGEFGTPEYDRIIVYYGADSEPVGYTLINPMGEVESYPYRSLMKWGMMTGSRFSELVEKIK